MSFAAPVVDEKLVHNHVYVLTSDKGFDIVEAYLRGLCSMNVFLRPRYGFENQFVAVLLPRIAQRIESDIKHDIKNRVVSKIEPLVLKPELDLPKSDECSFAVSIVWHCERQPEKICRKHIESLLDTLSGRGLVETKHTNINFERESKTAEYGRIILSWSTKEWAKARMKPVAGRPRECDLPFVRHLLNGAQWSKTASRQSWIGPVMVCAWVKNGPGAKK